MNKLDEERYCTKQGVERWKGIEEQKL